MNADEADRDKTAHIDCNAEILHMSTSSAASSELSLTTVRPSSPSRVSVIAAERNQDPVANLDSSAEPLDNATSNSASGGPPAVDDLESPSQEALAALLSAAPKAALLCGASTDGCKLPVSDSDLSIQCELCHDWWHQKCSKIGLVLFKHLDANTKADVKQGKSRCSGTSQLRWFCRSCDLRFSTTIGDLIASVVEPLTKRIDDQDTRVDQLCAATAAAPTAHTETTSDIRNITKRLMEVEARLQASDPVAIAATMARDFSTRLDALESLSSAAEPAILNRIEAVERRTPAITSELAKRIENLESRPSVVDPVLITAALDETSRDLSARIVALEDQARQPDLVKRIDDLEARPPAVADPALITAAKDEISLDLSARIVALEDHARQPEPTPAAVADIVQAIKTNAITAAKDVISDDIQQNRASWATIVAKSSPNDAAQGATSVAKGTIPVSAVLRSQVNQIKDDEAEAEKREKNLIIFNLTETTPAEDQRSVAEIFEICQVDITDDQITALERRGTQLLQHASLFLS